MPPKSEIERTLPHNLEAERALLGSILIDNGALNVVMESVTGDDFYSEAHRLVFGAMLAMSEAGRTIDIVTVAERLGNSGLLEKVGGGSYISSLTDGAGVAVAEYTRIVKEKSNVRKIINASNNVIARSLEGTDDSETLLEIAHSQLAEIDASAGSKGPLKLSEVVKQLSASGYISRVFEGQAGTVGVATGLNDLDSITAGIHVGEFTIIAARPSVGKSALGFQIAQHAGANGIGTGLFSLEMTKEAVLQRMICSMARIDSHKLRTGFCSREDCSQALKTLASISALPVYLDDTASATAAQIYAWSHRLKARHGITLVIVDYLQLVSTKLKFERRDLEVTYISHALKRLAKEEQLAVIGISQLSREPEKGARNREPKLSDLRESGSLEQDADVVIFLHKPPKSKYSTGEVIDAIVAKSRNGPTGRIPISFLKQFTRFENYAPP